ncbi:hypothetical protein COBT_003316 [Conglomerata obtusa]
MTTSLIFKGVNNYVQSKTQIANRSAIQLKNTTKNEEKFHGYSLGLTNATFIASNKYKNLKSDRLEKENIAVLYSPNMLIKNKNLMQAVKKLKKCDMFTKSEAKIFLMLSQDLFPWLSNLHLNEFQDPSENTKKKITQLYYIIKTYYNLTMIYVHKTIVENKLLLMTQDLSLNPFVLKTHSSVSYQMLAEKYRSLHSQYTVMLEELIKMMNEYGEYTNFNIEIIQESLN